MTTSSPDIRELRGLVPVELGIVVIAALVTIPIPVVVPLLAVASLSLWLRRRSWTSVIKGPPLFAAIGLFAGVAGLALSIVAGTPLVERVTDQAVQWSMYPIVRGSPYAFATLSILVGVGAIAAELVLRGWLVDRMVGLGTGTWLAVAAGAIAEALVADGDAVARAGAAVFGMAMGWMYIAGGRSVVAPICARAAFSLGALALESARVVG